MPLNNFGIIGPNVYRGAQPDANAVETLVALGVTCILKLNEFAEAPPTLRAGIVEWHVPMGLSPPPKAIVRQLVKDMAAQAANGILFVHCTHGRDRTGFVAAAYDILALERHIDQALTTRKAYGVDNRVSELTNLFFTRMLEELSREV